VASPLEFRVAAVNDVGTPTTDGGTLDHDGVRRSSRLSTRRPVRDMVHSVGDVRRARRAG
jgi:hypothetical protein